MLAIFSGQNSEFAGRATPVVSMTTKTQMFLNYSPRAILRAPQQNVPVATISPTRYPALRRFILTLTQT